MAVVANESIRHNGKVFKKGEIVEGLKPKEEARLLELGSASKIPTSKAKEKDGE
jgi:hypothetical protein